MSSSKLFYQTEIEKTFLNIFYSVNHERLQISCKCTNVKLKSMGTMKNSPLLKLLKVKLRNYFINLFQSIETKPKPSYICATALI